ncbi:hypothetical protein GQX73_g5537 [Xylaria multiplex]|uniref:2EXR domain-containing protein n=1 Tax=Xylaria multiplex TaxID=323545 RepID=A0A7C8ISH8_9PEZI|nr:hypothetical protein GQX73_g5537 [Xylaria multiplex]
MNSQGYQVVPYFNSLPAEIRHMIWKESVLVEIDNPQVLNLAPHLAHTNKYTTSPSTPLPLVNIGFPAAMHVNCESRDVALMYLNMVDPSRHPRQKSLVPQRRFRPEIDTLYCACFLQPQMCFSKEEIEKVQHLAIDMRDNVVLDTSLFFSHTFIDMPALRTLRLVLPTERQLIDFESIPSCSTPQRCVLHPIGEKQLGRVQILSQSLEQYRDGAEAGGSHFGLQFSPTHSTESEYSPLYLKEVLGIIRKTANNVTEFLNVTGVRKGRDAMERLTLEVCYTTGFYYSPPSEPQFLDLEDEFPDSPNPSIFVTADCHNPSVWGW